MFAFFLSKKQNKTLQGYAWDLKKEINTIILQHSTFHARSAELLLMLYTLFRYGMIYG